MQPQHDQGVLDFLEKAVQGPFPRDESAFGLDFTVHQDVFSPNMGCVPVQEVLGPFAGRELLEIGCGVGVLAVLAGKGRARRVVATDISPAAVANAKANVRRHKVRRRVEIRHGDLFEPIEENERFDIVYWNCPFHFASAEADLSMLQRSVFDPDYRAIRRYVLEGHRYVKPGGALYLLFSVEHGRRDLIDRFAREADLRIQSRRRWEPGQGTAIPIELLELQRLKG